MVRRNLKTISTGLLTVAFALAAAAPASGSRRSDAAASGYTCTALDGVFDPRGLVVFGIAFKTLRKLARDGSAR